MSKKCKTELRRLRKEADISQKQLADVLNVSQTAIGFWERGERTPSVNSAYKLAKFFEVPVEQLFLLE